jgi:hypothetical protein
MQGRKLGDDSRHIDFFECLNCDTTIRVAKPAGKQPQND